MSEAPKKTTVANVRMEPFDVYIGRAEPRSRDRRCWERSIYRNKYRVTLDRTLEMALTEYETLWRWRLASTARRLWQKRLLALRGKRLGCWCKPKPCHGDVLIKLIEEWSSESER